VSAAAVLRAALTRREFVLAPFVYDALQAKQAEAAGFAAVYMTGFGTAATYGFPDVGLLTMTEMVHNASRIASAVSVPVIADADTGYGNAVTVRRTVREYERAGVAALHIEDQAWPKKCGFFEGKQVIDAAEAAMKIRSAVDARRDPSTVIIARTDALAVHGWDDAEARARRYAEAGADMVFVDGIRTKEDVQEYARRLGDLRCLYNGAAITPAEAAGLGFAMMIAAGPMLAVYRAFDDALRRLRGLDAGTDGGRPGIAITDLLGLPGIYELERQYSAE
jgi:2-methylisocitrate lyase-like PEP mutase family enzyme